LSLTVSQPTVCTLSWLWPGRLALGKLAILDADPGKDLATGARSTMS
jgi:hypothetical protein